MLAGSGERLTIPYNFIENRMALMVPIIMTVSFILLFVATSRGERPGFQLSPTTPAE